MDLLVLLQVLWLCFLIGVSWFLYGMIRKYFQEKPALNQSLIDFVMMDTTTCIEIDNISFCAALIGVITIPSADYKRNDGSYYSTGLPPWMAAVAVSFGT